MRISDWSSDVCSSDLPIGALLAVGIYAYITHGGAQANSVAIVTDVVAASLLATPIGGGAAFALTSAFVRGWIPEYPKAPRSEERRGGKECVRRRRVLGAPVN